MIGPPVSASISLTFSGSLLGSEGFRFTLIPVNPSEFFIDWVRMTPLTDFMEPWSLGSVFTPSSPSGECSAMERFECSNFYKFICRSVGRSITNFLLIDSPLTSRSSFGFSFGFDIGPDKLAKVEFSASKRG